ncbi:MULTISPECIES: hypothetical protein [unclassified Bradyrhizobium]|uniref:hypothetical protein n=1 Tax=unclassified Bradyrhizobium TaxID=2631580 RepID=UPI00247A3415|nr:MULTISPECIES: hypothetical protein [unclassified Bradyrhizobium]WGR70422.1 hypothetical protein MTX24_34440 [Bradyrhizobium sp. ISRA426]WGR82478.1 hypothetical protein MTX21_19540 [Bradyrhizobium sp. ISRA430]WGR85664.1 hypothetical protein MTX25_34120 [Bradyrhizobium sp. ISRA432]
MTMSVEQLWSLPETALIGAYAEARRRYAEKKFERDTQRARLEWMRAKLFVNTPGNVGRCLGRAGAQGPGGARDDRDLDMLKIDVDVIETMIRLRGAQGAPQVQADEAVEKPPEPEGE